MPSEGPYYYEIEDKICGTLYNGVQPVGMIVWNMLHLKVNYQ